jgi:ABC-type sugar transport system substrate-binding protein
MSHCQGCAEKDAEIARLNGRGVVELCADHHNLAAYVGQIEKDNERLREYSKAAGIAVDNLRQGLAISEKIQHEEKLILIAEIEKNAKQTAEVTRLMDVLKLIEENGGRGVVGISCNGSWCAEQARRAREESK